jgi:SpoVK/Ycf46/Vps4 family AAA+-type ATPase
MDDAFLRRFQSIIHFPPPSSSERLKLWQKTLPCLYKPEPSINLQELADKYELNGAAILNVMHYASLKSSSRKDQLIRRDDIIEGIRKEFRKEERSVS